MRDTVPQFRCKIRRCMSRPTTRKRRLTKPGPGVLLAERFARLCVPTNPWRALGVTQAEWRQWMVGRKPMPMSIRRSIDAHLRLHDLGARGQAAFADLLNSLDNTKRGSAEQQLLLDLSASAPASDSARPI